MGTLTLRIQSFLSFLRPVSYSVSHVLRSWLRTQCFHKRTRHYDAGLACKHSALEGDVSAAAHAVKQACPCSLKRLRKG